MTQDVKLVPEITSSIGVRKNRPRTSGSAVTRWVEDMRKEYRGAVAQQGRRVLEKTPRHEAQERSPQDRVTESNCARPLQEARDFVLSRFRTSRL